MSDIVERLRSAAECNRSLDFSRDAADALMEEAAVLIQSLRAALEPFGKEAAHWADTWAPDTKVACHQKGAGCDMCGEDPVCEVHDLTVADLRRARALNPHTPSLPHSEGER